MRIIDARTGIEMLNEDECLRLLGTRSHWMRILIDQIAERRVGRSL